MVKALSMAGVLCSLSLLLFAQDSESLLTVTGRGEVLAEPDQALIRLGVIRRDAEARAAQQQANQTINRIVEAITALDVRREAIQTSTLDLHPVYSERRPREQEEPRIIAYEANYLLSVRLEDLEKIGPVVDAGLEAGANRLQGIQFRLKEEWPFRAQALSQAVEQAGRKAAAMAEAAGVRLLQIREMNEGGVSIVPPREIRSVMMAQEAQEATPVLPGEIVIQAVVTVRYQIEER